MSIINIPDDERDALKVIDIDRLCGVIEEYPCDEQPEALHIFRLNNCGPYVASHFRAYQKALSTYNTAKSAKITDTKEALDCAGDRLISSIQQMKNRLETEEQEAQSFRIDDWFIPPLSFTRHLTVRIPYQWYKAISDSWESGCIAFVYDVHQEFDKRDRQEMLYREWEYLRDSGLQSVRDYFRQGGDGSTIPNTFQVVVDRYTQRLNNISTQFWFS